MMNTRRTEAISLMKEGKYDEALPLLLSLKKDEIKEWVLYYAVGQCYKLTGNLPFSRRFLEAAKQINCMNAELIYVLGDVYHLSIRYEDAIRAFEDVISLYPNRIAAYNRIGVIYMQLGQVNEAESWFQKGLERIVYLKNAGIEMKQEEYNHMLNAKMEMGFVFPLRKAEDTIELNFLEAVLKNNMGICHLQRKEYTSARSYFQESIDLHPGESTYDDPKIYMVEIAEMERNSKKGEDNYYIPYPQKLP
jgi:tetratricopeptide (TPR) repeat protein